mmetsp:Transcript_19993/g.34240  ORF Transcript_19993/g.34240 Transcript_19993/m.34240 type:complete len:80 (+) Transcript_19993:50-289(+)
MKKNVIFLNVIAACICGLTGYMAYNQKEISKWKIQSKLDKEKWPEPPLYPRRAKQYSHGLPPGARKLSKEEVDELLRKL